jgi:hypothetical protein
MSLVRGEGHAREEGGMTAERIAELRKLLALVESEQPGDWRTGSIPGRVWAPYVEGKGISTVLYSGKGDKGHAYLLACEARNALPDLLDAAELAIALEAACERKDDEIVFARDDMAGGSAQNWNRLNEEVGKR